MIISIAKNEGQGVRVRKLNPEENFSLSNIFSPNRNIRKSAVDRREEIPYDENCSTSKCVSNKSYDFSIEFAYSRSQGLNVFHSIKTKEIE